MEGPTDTQRLKKLTWELSGDGHRICRNCGTCPEKQCYEQGPSKAWRGSANTWDDLVLRARVDEGQGNMCPFKLEPGVGTAPHQR